MEIAKTFLFEISRVFGLGKGMEKVFCLLVVSIEVNLVRNHHQNLFDIFTKPLGTFLNRFFSPYKLQH